MRCIKYLINNNITDYNITNKKKIIDCQVIKGHNLIVTSFQVTLMAQYYYYNSTEE